MVNGAWVSLETEEAIDEHVVDTAALIPPYKVLGLIHKEVVAVNFGFLGLRKKPNVPRRFRSGITPDTVDLIHPIIANLIASGKASMAELDAYYEQIGPRLYACDEARQALRLTFHPPVPDGNRVLKLGLPPVSALAFATLPRWARQLYGKPSGPVSDLAGTAGLRVARLAFSQQWLFLSAMRAIHRAEWAGDNQA